MTTTSQKPMPLLQAVWASLANAARYNPGDVAAPAAVLCIDADWQWRPLAQQLRGLMPELLTLGDFEPATRTGPAIWLRCVIESAVCADNFLGLVRMKDSRLCWRRGFRRQSLRGMSPYERGQASGP